MLFHWTSNRKRIALVNTPTPHQQAKSLLTQWIKEIRMNSTVVGLIFIVRQNYKLHAIAQAHWATDFDNKDNASDQVTVTTCVTEAVTGHGSPNSQVKSATTNMKLILPNWRALKTIVTSLSSQKKQCIGFRATYLSTQRNNGNYHNGNHSQ